MSDYGGARPPNTQAPLDSVQGKQWAEQLTNFVDGVAKGAVNNSFTGQNTFADKTQFNKGVIVDSQILLKSNYNYLVSINKFSHNATDYNTGGGNAALYIQHYVDSSTAPATNANIGARVQLETYQTAAPGLQNDAVAIYAGLYQGGVNIGGFGYHIDYTYAGSGASSTGYAFNAEMFRSNGTGVLVGYHLRIIQSAFSTVGTDYGFLVSPSPGGTLACNVCFAAGSSVFGSMFTEVGLDLAFAFCNTAAIRIPANQNMQWDGIGGFVVSRYNSGSATWEIYNGANLIWAVNLFSGKMFSKGPFTPGGALTGTTDLVTGATSIPVTGVLTINIVGVGDVNIPIV